MKSRGWEPGTQIAHFQVGRCMPFSEILWKSIMKQKTNDVNTFWSNFRDAVIRSGIDSSNADWYVKWAEKFAVSIKGRPLRQRTPKDIQQFLSKLKNRKGIIKWQVEQARDALKILYYDFLKFPIPIPEPTAPPQQETKVK